MCAWRRGMLLAAFLVLSITLLQGCSDSGDEGTNSNGGSEPISLLADIQPIFSASCALSQCHSGASPAGGMSLSAGQSYTALVGVPAQMQPDLRRVLPAEPDSSFLYHRLIGQGASVMPPGSSLPAAEIAAIRQWIEEGALNN